MLRKSQLIKALAGCFLCLGVAELLAQRLIKFPAAHLDNNSFIVKRRIFEAELPSSRDYIVFLGSSGFARGIDCLEGPVEDVSRCFNLSLDGGDAESYLYTYKKFIGPLKFKPKLLILELCEMTFGPLYESKTATENYLIGPVEHLGDWWSQPFSSKFKQALKNEVDTLFLWSALYQLSRRERLAHWTDLLSRRKTPPPFVGDFSEAAPHKVVELENLLKLAKADDVKVVMLAQGEILQGQYTNENLAKTKPYLAVFDLEQRGLVTFHAFPEKLGYETRFFNEGLIHVRLDQIVAFTKVIRSIVQRDF